MRRIISLFFLVQFSLLLKSQIIADHTVVDKYDDIPQYYIDQVKKMMLVVAGESHSLGYMNGLVRLGLTNPAYAVNYTYQGTPESYTSSHLRATGATWGDVNNTTGWIYGYGEEDWYKTAGAVTQTRAGITYCHDNNLEMSAFGFGWCYDGAETNMTGYLSATQSYIDHCRTNGYNTKVFFTTHAIDDWNARADETSYLKSLANIAIRDYVAAGPDRILFDYADILCYDEGSEVPNTISWNGHTYPVITVANDIPDDLGHISATGQLRLAKAMWWMLARIAGWNGVTTTIPVTGITVTGTSTITTVNGTTQLTATVIPSTATNKTVTWSIINGTGTATISSAGLVTALTIGTVKARATATDGTGIYGEMIITISSQLIPVTKITVMGPALISTAGGTAQFTYSITPSDATVKTVTWSIINGTGKATISSAGLVTAVADGTVTARATANDGSGVYDQQTITISNQISNQVVPVTGITVTGTSTITTDNGTTQLTATVVPSTATNKTVTWSIINGTGTATISSAGLVTALTNGTVTARATANDGTGIYGEMIITISSQLIQVTKITVMGPTLISTAGGTAQLTYSITPADATIKTVTWSIINGTGKATISSSGLVTAVADGTVTPRATANDGSGVYDQQTITISNQTSTQVVPVTGITVTGTSTITTVNGTTQLTATVVPSTATNKTVTWSIINGTGTATISPAGLVTALTNGTVTARATATDGTGIYGEMIITISSQLIPVTKITVMGPALISTAGGTAQFTYSITPADATVKTVTWSIINGTGKATISPSGLVTAVADGTVTARATANDGSGVYDQQTITISNQTSSQVVPVTGITVTGTSTITTVNGTTQLTATVVPSTATNKTVTWSIINGTGTATISSAGVVTALTNGTVTARATANDGTGIYGEMIITISSQLIQVTKITVMGPTLISTAGGTAQLTYSITPSDATIKTVTWSIINGTGKATISSSGLVTAVADGTVTARATANDGSGVYDQQTITISNQLSNQVVPVTGITVTGISTITEVNGTTQLTATVVPSTATNKTVTWSIINGTGTATISSAGVVTAVTNGTVKARATATDGTGIYGEMIITISSQLIPVTKILVMGPTLISAPGGTAQMTYSITPADATVKAVTWSIINGTGKATISSAGLVTALAGGTVTARATANDGSGIYDQQTITIGNQVVQVTGITVKSTSGSTIITTINGTLQLAATVFPSTATNQSVTWSIINGTGTATISSAGVVTALTNGTITARATANDGTGIYGEMIITISSQLIPVTKITVMGPTLISTIGGTAQLTYAITPSDATVKTVTWSIINGTGKATISSAGLVTALAGGTVTARATANDGSGIYDQQTITIGNQVILISNVTITPIRNSATISSENGELQLKAQIFPSDATDQDLTWSVINITGQATINSKGLVRAVSNGNVMVIASANDGSQSSDTLDITVQYPEFKVIKYENYIEIFFNEDYTGYQLALHNLLGQIIQKKKVIGESCLIETGSIPDGIYFLVLYDSIEKWIKKISLSDI